MSSSLFGIYLLSFKNISLFQMKALNLHRKRFVVRLKYLLAGNEHKYQLNLNLKFKTKPSTLELQAECDLRVAQSEFDRQAEITKLLLEGISTSQSSHLRHLHAFVEAQVPITLYCLRA